MKISTSALTGALAAAALTFGASSSDASITFGIKASSVTDGSPQIFAPETIFGTNFGVGITSGAFSVIEPPPGSEASQFRSPWDGGPDTSYQNQESATYFSVGGPNQPSPQSVTFAKTLTGLTMLLGSIDTYNSFKFNGTHTITGSEIAAAIGPGVVFGTTSAIIRFQGAITSMEVISTQAAAEFAVAAVPLPAAGFLMLAGLGGLVASRKMRRRADA